MNVGLFGGTFNPVHNGHIGVITHVKKAFGLDTVHLVPSAIPPHKPTGNLAPALDRFQMVKQAVLLIPGLTASDIELKREGRSFSIDTIRQFKHMADKHTEDARTSASANLFFIMGIDAFFDMNTWKGTREIFQTTTLIVMTRAGDTRKLKEIKSFLQYIMSSRYQYTAADGIKPLIDTCTFVNSNPNFKAVHICKVPEMPISSTGIRERIRNHQSVKGLVPDSVEAIIIKKGLYKKGLYFDKGK